MKYPVKRIIAGLDVKDGKVVKSISFVNFQDAGDPVENAALYAGEGIDEICLLDIAATVEKRKTFTDMIRKVSKAVTVPLSVSGGIRVADDVGEALEAGAYRVGIGSAAVRNPDLVRRASREYGEDKIIVSIDAKAISPDKYTVMIEMGRTDTGLDALLWAKTCEANGAGAILLTAYDRDGAKNGFDIPLCRLFARELGIPVIASGGAGSMEHFLEVLRDTEVEAAFAASVFHFGLVRIPELKAYLRENGVAVL